MWPYASATLRDALRSPLSWCLLVAGAFTAWFGVSAAVLALDATQTRAGPMILSSGQLVGVLLTLWLLGRGLEEDRHSGFAAAADATGPGPHGRVLGRWLGASGAGILLALAVTLVAASTSSADMPPPIYMLSTSIVAVTHVGAWGACLGVAARGRSAGLTVFLLWVLGHLPWGAAAPLDGPVGRLVGGLLPGPQASGSADALGYTSAAVAGLLLVTLALARPAE